MMRTAAIGSAGAVRLVAAALVVSSLLLTPSYSSVPQGTGPMATHASVAPSLARMPGTPTAQVPNAPHLPSQACPVSLPLRSALGLGADHLSGPGSVPFGGAGGLSAHSVDPLAVPNNGFEYNVTAYRMPTTGMGTLLLSEQEEIAGVGGLASQDLLMGYISNSSFTGPGEVPFWAVVDNATGHIVNCGYTVSTPNAGATYPFQALYVANRTWEVLYHGNAFAGSDNITLNGTEATWTGSLGVVAYAAWNGTSPWVPSLISVPSSMHVRQGNRWYLPHPVAASWNGTALPSWGEAGTVQRGYLAPGALDVGTSVATVTNGTELWTSASPTPLTVSVSANATHVVGGSTVALTVTALASNVAIPGLNVSMTSNAVGGAFSPALPWRLNATGVARGNYTSPLVSSSTSVTLTAYVGNGQFQGSGSAPTLTVSPTSLTVSVLLSSFSVAPGGSVNVTVVVDHAGQGVEGVNLSFSASVGGGVFTPAAPWMTARGGFANGSYLAPAAPGPVALTFTVEFLGFSGSTTAHLNVTGSSSPTPSAWSETSVIVIDAVLAVVLLGLALAYLRARTPRTPESEEEIDEDWDDDISATKSAEEPPLLPDDTPSASEVEPAPVGGPTCPACDAPLGSEARRFCPKCGTPLSTAERGGPKT
ncbi:MAG: zinc ribbon domain-containing protein [Euryarchaeota archaeon]|nr:zinc ribbon domain-containing protein [Euryarchaeota archaeon]